MKSLTVRLPDDLHEHLRQVAFEKHISMNVIIVAAITELLKDEDQI
jgi:predicted transcriptional regulator